MYDLSGASYNGQSVRDIVGDSAVWTFTNSDFDSTIGKKLPLGKLGDHIKWDDLPDRVRTDEVKKILGEFRFNPGRSGVLVCGTVGEVSNDHTLGGYNGYGKCLECP